MIQVVLSHESRFQYSGDAKRSSGEDDRERMLDKLIEQQLLGPSRQVQELDPASLPLRELPPGNISSLFLMYLAFVRVSGDNSPAGKSTFYQVSKRWSGCLKFRNKSEHAMCVRCQSLKAAIHASTDSHLVVGGWLIVKNVQQFTSEKDLKTLLKLIVKTLVSPTTLGFSGARSPM